MLSWLMDLELLFVEGEELAGWKLSIEVEGLEGGMEYKMRVNILCLPE